MSMSHQSSLGRLQHLEASVGDEAAVAVARTAVCCSVLGQGGEVKTVKTYIHVETTGCQTTIPFKHLPRVHHSKHLSSFFQSFALLCEPVAKQFHPFGQGVAREEEQRQVLRELSSALAKLQEEKAVPTVGVDDAAETLGQPKHGKLWDRLVNAFFERNTR